MKITITEAVTWVVGKLRDATLDLVPDQGQLEILTKRMEADVAEKRSEYHKALQAEVAIEDPNHPAEGLLPKLRAKLERRQAQGADWGKEHSAPGTSTQRKSQLMKLMEQCAGEIHQIEQEIATQEGLLKTCQETTGLRRTAYQAASEDLKKLRQVAPTILAQTQALKAAQKERLRAAADAAKGTKSGAGELVAQLQAELDQARAGASAAETIELEETPDDIDLDQVDEEREAEEASDDLVAKWTGKG